MRLLADIEGLSERELKDRIISAYECSPKEVNKYEIVLGYEQYASYEGTSYYLLYDREEDAFYEVSGGHCSCNGMEGQWSPNSVGNGTPVAWDVSDKVIEDALLEWRRFNGYRD